jgi:hypothetical protein
MVVGGSRGCREGEYQYCYTIRHYTHHLTIISPAVCSPRTVRSPIGGSRLGDIGGHDGVISMVCVVYAYTSEYDTVRGTV